MVKGIKGGGQRRTIVCECGYRIVGKPNTLDTISRLHNKVCPKSHGSKYVIPSKVPFDNNTNVAMDGFSKTRHGNPILAPNILTKNMVNGEFVSTTILTKAETFNDKVMQQHMLGLAGQNISI